MIETDEDVARHLAALLRQAPRLARTAAIAGPLPLRRGAGGLAGLCATIVAQQVSTASARAILARLRAMVDLDDAGAILTTSDETLRLAGLSRPKQRTLRAIAAAAAQGRLDFTRIAALPAQDAVAELVAIHGIGTWTAECHLLFGLGHEDIFPAGDLALKVAVAHALGWPERPSERVLRKEAEAWAPHRAVAARLFWASYAALTRRDATPASATAPAGGKPSIGTLGRDAEGFTKATR